MYVSKPNKHYLYTISVLNVPQGVSFDIWSVQVHSLSCYEADYLEIIIFSLNPPYLLFTILEDTSVNHGVLMFLLFL